MEKYINLKIILRKKGFKVTPLRLELLNIFSSNKTPFSPQSLVGKLKNKSDQATVYRNLKSFKNSGLIRQIDFRHNHPHYELADMKHHHHLICLKCGLSEEINNCGLELTDQLVLSKSKKFKAIKEHSLEFYGYCSKCS